MKGKSLVLTHNVAGFSNLVLLDPVRDTAKVKRVPSDSKQLLRLIELGKVQVLNSELGPTADVWVMRTLDSGWLSVTVAGDVYATSQHSKLGEDNLAPVVVFEQFQYEVEESKVVVYKLWKLTQECNLEDYLRPVSRLPEGVYRSFLKSYTDYDDRIYLDVQGVTQIELWGHTLNRLYGTDESLVDLDTLSQMSWHPPQVCKDTQLWRSTDKEPLYMYFSGVHLLYAGYKTLKEVWLTQNETKLSIKSYATYYDTLFNEHLSGSMEVQMKLKSNRPYIDDIRVKGEALPMSLGIRLVDYLRYCTVLVSDTYVTCAGELLQTSVVYDIVNDKIHLFKSDSPAVLGHYYGSMSVEEWLKSNP